MSGVRAALIRAFGNAVQVGVQEYAHAKAAPKKKRGLKGCQPCEAQKNADRIMREVRGSR